MRRKKRGMARFLRMKIVLALNVALLGVVVWGFGGEYVRNRRLQAEIGELKETAGALEARNSELAALRERFAGDGQAEREARLKLNLMRPGERVVVIKESGQTTRETLVASREEGSAENREMMTNPRKWLRYFLRGARTDDHYSSQ